MIGGGELRDGDTHLIDEEILSLKPEGSTFVFFGFAAQDSTNYADAITSVYGEKYNVVVPTVAKGREFAIDAMQSAALIYLGGGNTEQLMRVFSQWGLVEYLRAAIDRGTCVAGISAGAQALSMWYVHEESDVFKLRKGWGIAPIGVLVHATPKSRDKAASLWSSHQISNSCPFIAIGEHAACRISGSEATRIGLGDVWTLAAKS